MWEEQRNMRIQWCLPRASLFPSILFFSEKGSCQEYARASDRELGHYQRNQKKTKLGGWGGSAGIGACHQARLPEFYSQDPLLESKNWLELVLCPLRVPHTYIHVPHTHIYVPHTHIHVPYTYIHVPHTYTIQTKCTLSDLKIYKIESKDRVATFKQSVSFKFLT